MNAIFSIGLQSMEELIQLCPVPSQIISPRDSKPITAVVQDIATGLYRLTKNHVLINERQFMNIMSNMTNFNGELPMHRETAGAGKFWSGRQALSMILPERLNMEVKTDGYHEEKTAEENENFNVVIRNGEILGGAIGKDQYQGRTRGIIHSVYNEYGPDETRKLFDNTQKLVCDWLVYDGFSTGISDLIISKKSEEEFKEIIRNMKVQVYEQIRLIHEGKFENNSTKNNSELFEDTVNNTYLNKANSKVGDKALGQINDRINRLINMVKSKSKGSTINVAQMIGCVGQQNVEGRRIPYGFDDRTLPHYTKYDDGPESRGFVENSFIKGLSPQEFFFHAMGGREGLIDTAVQSVTGDTPIIIIENGVCKYVKIGDWIDAHLAGNSKDKIKYFPENNNIELLDLDTKVHIPTTDQHGNITWGELTAVTRHDPGERLYEIHTSGGRNVIVAESKSLLIWDETIKEFKMKHSPDVKVGEYVPVTANLPTPPIIIDYVDMSEYFPKDEYIHGMEFNKAARLMKEARGDKFHIPRGWWSENNGKTFTLPYRKKASLTRATSGRSNTENIKDGRIYPYHATREHATIFDKFELNEENGIFIGLYIAEGSSRDLQGSVSIANTDRKVKDFVVNWFNKHGIASCEYMREMRAGTSQNISTTSSVVGYSSLLARFLDRFVGHGSHNKFIPSVAFVAPEEFIIGLLNGYIAGDGCVSLSSITTSSVSKRLTEGVAMLCSRLGVYGYISTHKNNPTNLSRKDYADSYLLTIKSKWASLLASKISCILDYKNERLQNMKCSKSHCSYKDVQDVVLDPITSIKVLGVEKYPKLYDVTVPSTLNFALANGLSVLDTSETGYIQRKLVKAMEDCKVNYDMTVRNAGGVIVQYLYGEDGMDACKIDSQTIPHIDMDHDKINAIYNLVSGVDDFKGFVSTEILADLKANAFDFTTRYDAHYKQVLEDREHVIIKMNHGKQESSVMYPVSLQKLLVNTQNTYAKYGANIPHDLDPNYVFNKLDELCNELVVTKTYPGNKLFKILLRSYLSPKRVIIIHKLTKNAFDAIVDQIKYRFFDSLVHPSEMVGVVAAQSIGEPSTQLVLNSVSYDTEILLNFDGLLKRVKIGEYIDQQMERDLKIEEHPHDTKLAWLDSPVTILSCDDSGKVAWKRVEAVTRHPVVNKDGTNTVLKVTTQSGRTVIATKGKSFLKRIDNKIVQTDGEDLRVGDYLPVSTILPTSDMTVDMLDISEYLPKNIPEKIPMDSDFGFFIGAYLAEGCTCSCACTNKEVKKQHAVLISNIDENFNTKITSFMDKLGAKYHIEDKLVNNGRSMTVHIHSILLAELMSRMCGNGAARKRVPTIAFQAPNAFVKGMVDGYFSGDGTVRQNRSTISVSSASRGLLEDMRQLLVRFGINTAFIRSSALKPTASIQDSYYLALSGPDSVKFAKTFNLTIAYKQAGLDRIVHRANEWRSKADIIPNVKLEECGEVNLTRTKALAMLQTTTNKNDRDILQAIADETIFYDKVVNIKEIPNPTPYVYDLTVEDTRNFNAHNGLALVDTFHSSGISAASKAVRGVPRLNELLAVSKKIKTPMMRIFLRPDVNTDKRACLAIMNDIRTVRFKDIIKSSRIYFDPTEFNTNIPEDRGFIDSYKAFLDSGAPCNKTSPWLLRFEVDRDKIQEFKLDMITLHHVLSTFYDDAITCIFADDNSQQLIMRVRIKISEDDTPSSDDMLTDLKALEHNIIENVVIKGIKNVHRTALEEKKYKQYNSLTGVFDDKKEWMMYTEGSNLRDVLNLLIVDAPRTMTNDVNEVYEVLGIEAARQALYNEIVDVMDGIQVNYRHIALLVDVMTNRGNILSVNRHGINRGDIGPLAKCSFEETTDKLIKAGVFAEYDKINGVSANVMLGQIAPCGTGDVCVIMDEILVSQMPDVSHAHFEVDDNTAEACAPDILRMDMPMPLVKDIERKTDNDIVFV